MGFLGKIIAKLNIGNTLFGAIIYESRAITGQSRHSFCQWRVNRKLDGENFLLGLKMRSDYSAGSEGSPTSYINFDIHSAKMLRDELDRCISEFERYEEIPVSSS